jgi:hypothetical protein
MIADVGMLARATQIVERPDGVTMSPTKNI